MFKMIALLSLGLSAGIAAGCAELGASQRPVVAPAPQAPASDTKAIGRQLFEKTAGGIGCAACHGLDGKGLDISMAPDIRGADEARVRGALANVMAMGSVRLTDAELAAVVAYLRELGR